MDRAGTGRRGEAAAARFYEKQGAALITHNYHTRICLLYTSDAADEL